MNEKTCAIMIKRYDASPAEISEKLEAALQNGCVHFLSGLEYGTGLSAAEAILARKAACPFLTLECVIPFEEYTSAWDEPSRDRYFAILSRCDRETMLQTHYSPDCMARQRAYLLLHGDVSLEI